MITLSSVTLLPALMFMLGIPAALWACVQIYNFFFSKPSPPTAADGTPVSYKKVSALTWTTEVKVIERK